MKFINFIALGLGFSFAACQSSQNSKHQDDSTYNNESGPGKIVNEQFLIVPGRSIGEISLGESVEGTVKKLGKPDAGDAAMGKEWSIWYSKDVNGEIKNEIAIYSSYRDSSMKVKDIKQIRITSSRYRTQDGYTLGRSEFDTKMKFPGIEPIRSYLNEQQDTVKVYDSKTEGIGVEFLKGKSISLTVHPKNQSVNETYLTLHPEWKVVE